MASSSKVGQVEVAAWITVNKSAECERHVTRSQFPFVRPNLKKYYATQL